MVLNYSNLNNPPTVLDVPHSSNNPNINQLSGTDTNTLNLHTSKFQNAVVGGRRKRRRRCGGCCGKTRRQTRNRKHKRTRRTR